MVALEALQDFVVGRLTFPLTNHLLNRRHIIRTYRSLVRTERFSADELAGLQLGNLKRVLAHAQRWSPYYRELFRSLGFDPAAIRSVGDLRQLPPLSRETIIEHRREMVDRRLRPSVEVAEHSGRPPGSPIPFAVFRRNRLVRNTSTGSTGAPVIFYEDGSASAMNWAHEMRLKARFGVGPGAREARFARVSSEYLPKSRTLNIRRHLWHQLVVPGMNVSDADFRHCFERIRTFRPRVLFGLTSAMTGFAEYLRKEGLAASIHPLDVIVTWAAPVYEPERQLLAAAFGCPVSNIYGSREVGHVACECPRGRLHVNQEHYYVEIEPVADGGPADGAGEILVTPLFETPMPFVRYRVGDVGRLAAEPCPCGRGHAVLDELLGRSGEVFTTRDGRIIAPNFWCRTFMGDGLGDAVERFQVVLRDDETIRFRVVPRSCYTPETENRIRDYLAPNLPRRTRLEFQYVSRIDPQPSGKYQMVVDERITHQSRSLQPEAQP